MTLNTKSSRMTMKGRFRSVVSNYRHLTSTNGVPLKFGLGVNAVQGH